MSLNFRTLDLNLLRVLDAVMAEGSLTRAAALLAMTQPAVSHAMKRLREALGDELFVRSAHGMKPTPLAEAIWPQVREALATLRQALVPGDFDPRVDAVQLRVAMADATAALLAPALVQGLNAAGAVVHLLLTPLTTRDPRALLEAGQAELAVGFFPDLVTTIAAQGAQSHLRFEHLYNTRYVCVMRRDHPLASQDLTLDRFCAAQHLQVSFSGRPYSYVDQALTALGRKRHVALTVNQFFTAARVVVRTELLAVLPEGFADATGYAPELVTRELPLTLAPVSVAAVWHLRNDAAPAHRWLRAQIRASVPPRRALPA